MPVAPGKRVLRPLWFEDLEPCLTSPWLIDGVIPLVGVGLLFGHPGCGKSFLSLDLALHVAAGRQWHGHEVEMGAVLYIAAEGGDGVLNRIAAFKQHYQPVAPAFGILKDCLNLHDPCADVDPVIEALKNAAAHFDCSPALVIIDTLSKTFGDGKENTDDMRVYVANCEKIAVATKSFVLLVHHRPKDIDSRRPRGHGSLEAGVDTAILIEMSRKSTAPRRAVARVTKQKDGVEGPLLSFTLRPLRLGTDERGHPVSSCIIEPSDQVKTDCPPDEDISELSGHCRTFLEILESELAENGDISTGEAASMPVQEFRAKAMKVFLVNGSAQAAKKAFSRSLTKLTDLGMISVDNSRISLGAAARGHGGHEGQNGDIH